MNIVQVRLRHALLIGNRCRFFSFVNNQYDQGNQGEPVIDDRLKRKLKLLEMLKEERIFHYDKKAAKTDPKTGRIELYNVNERPPKTLIKNYDDLEREKAKLYKELNLEEKDVQNSTVDELAEGYQKMYQKTEFGFEIDESQFYATSQDNMRIDCGLIIMRPPIFLSHPKRDHDWNLYRNQIGNEYLFDMKKYYEEFKEEASMLESPFARNSWISPTNKDNTPSHKMETEDGEVTYCGASKNWRLVNPDVTDHHSLHYAAQQRVFLLLKNKYTEEWEFPSKPLFGKQSFTRVRRELFTDLTHDKWMIRHLLRSPGVATMRPFTEAEKKDRLNSILSGVRTYYFHAYHLRGLPEFDFEKSDYMDYSWVPKTDMNKFLTRERFDVFQNSFMHR